MDIEMSEFITRMVKEEQERREELSVQKVHICNILKVAGIDRVVAEYEGSGDSGNMQDIACYKISPVEDIAAACAQMEDVFENVLDEVYAHAPFREDLYKYLWECAYGAHPGFEINEGGRGTVTILVGSCRVIVEHWNYVTTEEQENDVEY